MSVLPPSQDSQSERSIHKSIQVLKVERGELVTHEEVGNDDLSALTEQQLRWPKIRTIWQNAFSEFVGTMILILFGDGVVAQVVLSGGKKGDYVSICWGWG